MPVISVIVPVYKVEDYLRECVDSILAQSFADFELILVDDGSPDSCGVICDEYAKIDSRVRVIHQENMGLSGARNTGIDVAVGEYITFIDSDDAVLDIYLEQLLICAKRFNSDVACCKKEDFYEKIPPTNSIGKTYSCRCISAAESIISIYNDFDYVGIYACAKLYKNSLFRNFRFPIGKIHEDQAVIPLVLYNANSVALIDLSAYLYRRRAGSITKSLFSEKRYDELWAIDSCISKFDKLNETEIVKAAKRKRKLLVSTYYIRALNSHSNVPKQYRTNLVSALGFIRRNTSDDYYEYYLGILNPKLALLFEWEKKLRQIIGNIFKIKR